MIIYPSVFLQVGIVSFGSDKCGTAGVPSVYSSVHRYAEWIRKNTVQMSRPVGVQLFHCITYLQLVILSKNVNCDYSSYEIQYSTDFRILFLLINQLCMIDFQEDG